MNLNSLCSFTKKYLVFSLVLTSTAIANFEIRPFVVRLQASQGQLTGFVDVQTTQNHKPVAVELTVHERVIQIDGTEEAETPESNDVIVYPAQIVVQPGKKVRVQVAWAGDQSPTTDRAYVLLAREVPLDLKNENSNSVNLSVSTMIQYRAVIAIETGGKGNLRTVEIRKDEQTEKIALVVENIGSGRVPMDGFYLIIRGQPYRSIGDAGGNSIMPGDQRRFLLDLPYLPGKDEIRFGAE